MDQHNVHLHEGQLAATSSHCFGESNKLGVFRLQQRWMPCTAGATVVEHFLSVSKHFTGTALLHHGLDVCSLCIESAHKLHQKTLQDVMQLSMH